MLMLSSSPMGEEGTIAMECRHVYDRSSRLLSGRCVEAKTTLSSSSSSSSSSSLSSSSSSSLSSSSSSSLLSSSPRRSHGQSPHCGGRGGHPVSSLVPSRFVVALLHLVWIWLVVVVVASDPDLPRSRSRHHHHFRFLTPRSVSSPPQDTAPTTPHRPWTPAPGSSLEDPPADGVISAGVFTLPVRSLRPQSPPPPPGVTRRLSIRKILEGSEDGHTVRRTHSSSQIETIRRHNAEIVASIRVKPVPAEVFRLRLLSARSYRDIIRLFLRSEERLRDEDIDDFIIPSTSNSRQSIDDNSIPVNEWELALSHLQEMEEKGACRQPVAKFIQVRYHALARPESTYVPDCTVVYRCHKDYGCCNATSECGVKTSTSIYRSFWELTCPPGSNCTEYNMPNVKTLHFVNHTECECKPVKQLPRCKLCPLPFEILSRDGFVRCNCTCHPDNRLCTDVENGRIPMETLQASCIRESNCEKPHCQHGHYDVQSGSCPCPDGTPECLNVTQGQVPSDEDISSRTNETETATNLTIAMDNQTTNGQQTTNAP